MPQLEAESGLRRGRVELMLKQLAVDGGSSGSSRGGCAGAAWTYDREHYDGIVATRRREADIMRDYTRGRRCLMQLLQESLDDASAAAVRPVLGLSRPTAAGCASGRPTRPWRR